MKVALAQIEVVSGNKKETLSRILGMIHESANRGAGLVIFPELCNTAYFCIHWDYNLLDLAEPIDGPTVTAVMKAARKHDVHVMLPIYLEDGPGVKYNAAIAIDSSGKIQGVYRKLHPAARLSLEKIYFKPGRRLPVFQLGEWRVAALICYDTYFPEAARCLALDGCELLVLPFASPGMPIWTSVHSTRAYENGVFVAAVNRSGTEPGPADNTYMGRSLIADPFGKILVEADASAGIFMAEIDRSLVRERNKAKQIEWRARRPDMYDTLTRGEEEVRARL